MTAILVVVFLRRWGHILMTIETPLGFFLLKTWNVTLHESISGTDFPESAFIVICFGVDLPRKCLYKQQEED
jgi:hypothetical protein